MQSKSGDTVNENVLSVEAMTAAGMVVTGRPKSWIKKVFKEWSFYALAAALVLNSAPDLIPHLNKVLTPFLAPEKREALTELLLIISLLGRFIPQKVRVVVQQAMAEETVTVKKKGKG